MTNPLAQPPARTMASILEDHALPWYVIDADRRVIRVYHGDLDQSWWKRGMSDGEGKVRKVGDIIREATGLQRVTCIHDGDVVEFRVRKELFNRAAVALKMSIKCVAESNDLARRMVDRKRKPE